MELLYIWIEEYKNIKEQGFNFSSKHRFEFIPEKDKDGKIVGGKLCHEENSNHIENFFGENITNVTAIIGENGAGKSSLLEIIISCYYGGYVDSEIVMVVFDQENYNIYTLKDSKIELSKKHNLNKLHDWYNSEHFQLVFYALDSHFTFINGFSDIDAQSRYWHINKEQKFSDEVSKMLNFISQFKTYKNIIKFNLPRYLRCHIIETTYSEEKEKVHSIMSKTIEGFKNQFVIYLKKLVIQNYIHEFQLFVNEDLNDSQSINIFFSKIINNDSLINEINLLERILNKLSKNNKAPMANSSHTDMRLDLDKENHREIIRLLSNIISKETPISNNVNMYWEFEKGGYISYGESKFLFLLSNLFHISSKLNNIDNVLILIDEGELGFHPQWQKEYLKILIDFLPQIFPDKKIQIILTSHSPFLVSDLPKENIIFLSKNDEGKCVVSKLQDRKETFGANIHTLFTDSFFMKGGLMGTFAQKRIDEVIAYLNGEELEGSLFKGKTQKEQQDLAQKYISMIGEPIIKNMLQKQLNTKRLEKVESHEERIKKLEEELEVLKKAGKTEL
ncbi:MAG: ATP-binding protein [Raineya sp.]|jgi:predicted ATPase|nr:ATP-binding protein [Raineya sp.]